MTGAETDWAREKVMELIEQAQEPKDKAVMLVQLQLIEALQKISGVVHETREAQEAHDKRFTAHEAKEMALINQGKGVYRSAIYLLGVIQTIILGVGIKIYGDFTSNVREVREMRTEIEVHREFHRMDEHRHDPPAPPPAIQPMTLPNNPNHTRPRAGGSYQ